MYTCKSPRKVMRAAYHLACRCLPTYSCKFSRHDFTLPQLLACLTVKEMLRRSYRGAETLLRDSDNWLRDIGLARAPDHNTLCRAAKLLLGKLRVNKLLDVIARWAATARLLNLSRQPLAIDSSMFESHHVSRHYERRKARSLSHRRPGRGHKKPGQSRRKQTVESLPKLGLGAEGRSHLILSCWTGTGLGSDSPHFKDLVFHAWRRVPNRRFKVAGDGGYDAEHNHVLARRDLGLISLMPAVIGRTPASDDRIRTPWRRHMKRLLRTKSSRRRCGYTQRWQVETVNSMIKRNLGSATAGKTPASRQRDLRLKVITHNMMVV